jgi:hypothetical protein
MQTLPLPAAEAARVELLVAHDRTAHTVSGTGDSFCFRCGRPRPVDPYTKWCDECTVTWIMRYSGSA